MQTNSSELQPLGLYKKKFQMKILFIASKRIKVLEEVKMGLKVLYKSNPFFKEEIQKRSPNKSTRGAVPKRATESQGSLPI